MWNRLCRVLKHSWLDGKRQGVTPEMLARIQTQIQTSETLHSGEICVCVESALPLSYAARAESTPTIARQRALAQFGKLRVWDTEHNNGVLIYVLLAEHAIEIIADRGLNQHVSPQEWQVLVELIASALSAGRIEEGLALAVDEVSAMLQNHFGLTTPEAPNPNELPDPPVWDSF